MDALFPPAATVTVFTVPWPEMDVFAPLTETVETVEPCSTTNEALFPLMMLCVIVASLAVTTTLSLATSRVPIVPCTITSSEPSST